MKRILAVFIVLLLSAAAAAQQGVLSFRDRLNAITRLERLQLQKDMLRFRIMQRQAEKDGIISPFERKKLQKMKRKTRRDAIRYRLNRRSRVI